MIPTYNRFESLNAAIESVRAQTHAHLEIIVVNDGSTDVSYYTERRPDVVWVDLPANTRSARGYPSPGHVRNQGVAVANGDYVAFLDDDDLWLPDKTRRQLAALTGAPEAIACAEAFMGDGRPYRADRPYPEYHAEHHRRFCEEFFETNYGERRSELPARLTHELIAKHNFMITSSVIVSKRLLDTVGEFRDIEIGQEDWDLWLRCLEYSDCLHLAQPLVYYRNGSPRSAPTLASRAYRRARRLARLRR